MAISSTMAMALVLSARTEKASAAIDKFTNKTLQGFKKLNSEDFLRKGFINLEIGKQVLAPVTSLVDKAVKFENAMAGVAKYADGAALGTDKFNQLSERALAISSKMGEKAEDVAENMAALAAAGTPVKDLDRMAEKTVILAKAFDVLPGVAGEAYKMIQAVTGLSENGMDSLMDAQNELTNKFGSTRDAAAQLLEFMKGSGGSVARGLKMDANNMAAVGNTMRVLGIETSEAETTMRRFEKTLLKGEKAGQLFAKAGGGTKGFLAIMEAANKHKGGATAWFMENDFGEYSSNLGKLAMGMKGDGVGNLKNQLAGISDKGAIKGSANQEAADAMNTRAEAINRFKSSANALGITLGNALLPSLSRLLDKADPLLKLTIQWAKENKPLVSTILKLVVGFAGLKIATGAAQLAFGGILKPVQFAVKGFGSLSKGIITINKHAKALRVGMYMARESKKMLGIATTAQKMGKAFSFMGKMGGRGFLAIGKAMGVVFKMLMANPWMLAIAGIIIVVALIIRHWDKIKVFFKKLWDWVKKTTAKAWEWIKKMFLNYTPHGLIIKHWSVISEFFSNLWENVKTKFSDFITYVTKWANTFKDIGLAIVKAIWEGIKNKWTWLKDKAVSLWKGFKNVFKFGGSDDPDNNPANPTNPYGGGPNIPQPIPVAARTNNNMQFAPVFNVSGGMDEATQSKMTSQLRRDFEKQMNDFTYNQNRKNIGR